MKRYTFAQYQLGKTAIKHCWWDVPSIQKYKCNEFKRKKQLPYSLKIMPPLFISPYYLHEFDAEVYLPSNLRPPRPLRLQRTIGRLELTVPPYIWSLATYWPVIRRPSDWLRCSRLVANWWWCENCITFSDRSHSAPSLIISWSFALQNWATMSFIASRTRRWRTICIAVSFTRSTARKGAY